jgi:L-lactate dehydrogenase (cytochrome)/(S)-mandelate dehydrogenase
MRTDKAVNIADLRLLAKRRLPRIVFEVLDGASEDQSALVRNMARLREHLLVQRVLRNGRPRDHSTTIFSKTYASSFGIAPTGFIGVMRNGIEFMLAEAALEANIPMILSGVSAQPIEKVAARAPGQVWSQIYAAKDPDITTDMVRRARDSGVEVLVWSVDMGAPPKNENQMRSGAGFPPSPTLGSMVEALAHPGWLLDYLSNDAAAIGSWQPYIASGAPAYSGHKLFMAQRFESLQWKMLDALRRHWSGPFVVKGILHPEDALRVAEGGADGVIVSNHGGIGLDRAPASIDMLPGIVEAVGSKLIVMFDSGIRRGSDAVVARCLGAQMVFVGRPTLYGASAGGKAGALRAINILKDEIERTMGQIGCATGADLKSEFVRRSSM